MNKTCLNHIKRYAPALGFTIIFIVLLAAIVYSTLTHTLTPCASSAPTADVRSLSGFTYEIDGVGMGEVILPHTFTDLSPHTAVTLHTKVDAGSHEILYVKTNFAPLGLYVDNKLVYECGQDGSYPAFFIDPPTIITMVPLPDGDGIQSLRFEYLFPRQRELQLPQLFIGDEATLLTREFNQNGVSFLFSIILMSVGVAMAGIALVVIRSVPAGSPLLWLGLFATATGMWIFGECDLTAFLVPYSITLYVMTYTSLFILALLFLQYGQLMLQPRNKLPLQVMKVVLCISISTALALQLAGVVSLARSLFLFHILIPLSFFVFAVCLIWEYVRYQSAQAQRFALPILILSASSVLGVVNYQIRFTNILPLFFQLGILLFIILMGFIAGCFASEAIQTSAEKRQLETEVASINKVLDLQREQYELMVENVEAVKAQRHDLRHQLAVIKGYNNVGGQEKLNAYLNELTTNIPVVAESMLCENFVVNAVALHYATLAETEGIKTSIQLIVPEKTGCLRDCDLSILFGNLLENAIEACKWITDGERFIKLRSRIQNDILVITMDNSFDGYYNEKDKVFYSRKRGMRGIGLSSVLAVAKKYDGNARFEVKANVFLSSVYVSAFVPKTQAETSCDVDVL